MQDRKTRGKIERILSEVNTRAVSRGQNELIGKLKMVAGDVISVRGQVLEYTYIPTGMNAVVEATEKRNLKWYGDLFRMNKRGKHKVQPEGKNRYNI